MEIRTILGASACAVAALATLAGPSSAQGRIQCTPKTVQGLGKPPSSVTNPIARALELAQPGSVIDLAPGEYPAFAIGFGQAADDNAITTGGANGRPIIVRAHGKVKIRRHRDGGDTIALVQQKRFGYVTFEGLTIEASYRAAVMFYAVEPGQSHDAIRFLDCHIEGNYDHLRKQGADSKWGVYGRALRDFEWRGQRGRSTIRDLQHEHAFYLQNPAGDILIENTDASLLGRTFLQVVSRPHEGPPGNGRITLRNNRIEDACVAPGDNFKGGCTLTFAGRHRGTVWLENNVIRTGFDDERRALTAPGDPYGTGALLVWAPEGDPLSELVLIGNRFEFDSGCGDRPLVSLQGLKGLWLGPGNTFKTAQDRFPALTIEPRKDDGSFQVQDLMRMKVDAPQTIEGRIEYRGEALTLEQIASQLRR